MFTLVFDIFIMCFALSEILSLEEEEEDEEEEEGGRRSRNTFHVFMFAVKMTLLVNLISRYVVDIS
jgi:hypothetical protein